MKLEDMERMLEQQINIYEGATYMSSVVLNSLSNAVQALLMVRQEMDRQKALDKVVEPEKVNKGNPFI